MHMDVNELVTDHLRWAGAIAVRMAGRRVREDAVSAAHVGLIVAARKFNVGRGVSFRTYAAFWIRKMVRREIREGVPCGYSFAMETDSDEPFMADPPSQEPGPAATVGREDDRRKMRRLVARLEPRCSDVVRLLYGIGGDEPMTGEEAARHLHLSRQAVALVHYRALERLRWGWLEEDRRSSPSRRLPA